MNGIYMRKYTINKDNITEKKIYEAISLKALVPRFNNKVDQDCYGQLSVTVYHSVLNHIRRVYREHKEQFEQLSETLQEDDDYESTYIKRCIKMGKRIEKKFTNHKTLLDHFNYIIPALLKAYRSNSLIWINRNKNYYYKKNLERYYNFIFDIDVLCLCFDSLEQLGYLYKIAHKKGKKFKKGRCTRYALTGLVEKFDEIQGVVKFRDESCKEIVILKDEYEVWKTVTNNDGTYSRYMEKRKKLINYIDSEFTLNLRNDLTRLNKYYSNRIIEVKANNIILPLSYIPKLVERIRSERVLIKKIVMKDKDWGEYSKCIDILREEIDNKLIISGKDLRDSQYKYILSKKNSNNKKCDLFTIWKDYVFIKEIDFEIISKSVRAVFNRGSQDFDFGGRKYGAEWTSLPKVLRENIYIDGQKTVGLDFKALHIMMAYHLLDKPCPFKDPYTIQGYTRNEVKLASLISINAQDDDGARHGIIKKFKDDLKCKINEEYADLLLERMKGHHWRIQHFMTSDSGIRFQNIDARIMRDALVTLMEDDICGLGVHDEIIVPVVHLDRTKQQMIDSYRYEPLLHGFEPIVTVNRPVDEDWLKSAKLTDSI